MHEPDQYWSNLRLDCDEPNIIEQLMIGVETARESEMTEKERDAEPGAVRTALIGYGLAGSVFHAPLIDAVNGLQLSAIVVKNAQRQEAARRDYPHTKIFSSADELWQNSASFDLVVVATPNDTHAGLAETAMQRGLAVVVDKPFAISTSQARHLIEVQKHTGVKLSVFQNRRWDCDFLTVEELIDTGKVGTVTRLESRYERYRPVPKPGNWRETTQVESGGGLLFDLGSHLIDQALHLFGNPVSIYAEMKTRRSGVFADDDTFVALQFDNDVCAHLWVSLLAKTAGPRFRLLGSTGAYEKWGMDTGGIMEKWLASRKRAMGGRTTQERRHAESNSRSSRVRRHRHQQTRLL